METIVVTVKGVKVYVDETSASVQLTIDKTIKGFSKNDDDDSYTEKDVNTVSISRKKLIAQLCDVNDDIAMYRATLDHAFGQKEFGVILFNAQLTLNRTFVAAGEIIGEGDDVVAVHCIIHTEGGFQAGEEGFSVRFAVVWNCTVVCHIVNFVAECSSLQRG